MSVFIALLLCQLPPNQSHSPLVADVTQFGARADAGATDNAPAIQRAIDLVANRPGSWSNHGGVVYIPGATSVYGVKSPVYLDRDGVTIVGDGPEVSRVQSYGHHPAFVLGVRRVETSVPAGSPQFPNELNRPDAYFKLDGSAVVAREEKWGYRTGGNSFLQCQATPLTLGVKHPAGASASDEWGTVTALTLEACVDPEGGPFAAGTPLFGAGDYETLRPAPVICTIWRDPLEVLVAYRAAAAPSDYAGFSFHLPANILPPYKIALTIDLGSGQRQAFVNGQLVALSDIKGGPPGGQVKPVTGGFAANRFEPWYVGKVGINGNDGKPTSGADFSLYGLHLSRAVRYKSASGSQVRVDTSEAPNDLYAYFTDDKDTVAFLPFDEDPSNSRTLAVCGGQASYGNRAPGFIFQCGAPQPVSRTGLRDLSVQGWGQYGFAIAQGAALETTYANLRVFGAYYGIGALIRRDGYRTYLRECDLSGHGSAYFGYSTIVDADRITFSESGVRTILLAGCDSSWRSCMVTTYSPQVKHTFSAISGWGSGKHRITDLVVDYEGVFYQPGGSAIRMESVAGTGRPSLTLDGVSLGTLGQGVPALELIGGDPKVFRPSFVTADNFAADGGLPVKADPLWSGTINGGNLKAVAATSDH